MAAEFRRPITRVPAAFDTLLGASDPAETARLAHASAAALLARVQADESGDAAERMVRYVREHGIDEIAELWATAPAVSLPGALWRLYVLHTAIHRDPVAASMLFSRGQRELNTADVIVAGAQRPADPAEILRVTDEILCGAFRGDFAVALERAAAFCRLEASGATHIADDADLAAPADAAELTRRALRYDTYGRDLAASASLWRAGRLA